MTQPTFASLAWDGKGKVTRRERFLAEMDAVVPWSALLAVIQPHYPKPKGPGRRPYPMETMLRVHLMQNWFGYSDPGMEEALYEVAPLRQFARLSLSQIPDETTILNFRHLLEAHDLAAQVFAAVNTHLTDHGLFLRQGTQNTGVFSDSNLRTYANTLSDAFDDFDAATRRQAQEVVADRTPGLVLADIQLADGSSGLDAVDDILEIDSVPVIFITAYPERLLTGDRPEPTYLITKPFQEDTVRAAISQALFFGSSRPLS